MSIALRAPRPTPDASDHDRGRRHSGRHWLGLPVVEHRGKLEDLRKLLPHFERLPFAAPRPGVRSSENPIYDVIVRAGTDDIASVPVGVVSKRYQLVQHRDIFDRAVRACLDAKIDVAKMDGTLGLTENGERMELALVFPDEDRFRFRIDDGDAMRLRFQCFNSVDGSSRFSAVLGWLRFVCSNGLVVGKAMSRVDGVHGPYVSIEALLAEALERGLADAVAETGRYDRWRRGTVKPRALEAWADGPLRLSWGPKAAAQVLHVALHGHEVEVIGRRWNGAPPSLWHVRPTTSVPGAILPADAFAVAQALSWVAGRRLELSDRLERIRQIPELVEDLLRAA
jgi:hypothetical protein